MPNMAGGGRTVREAKCSHCYCPAPSVKIYRGTVRDDGAALAAKVPAGLTIVIYRSAVLIYVDEERFLALKSISGSQVLYVQNSNMQNYAGYQEFAEFVVEETTILKFLRQPLHVG